MGHAVGGWFDANGALERLNERDSSCQMRRIGDTCKGGGVKQIGARPALEAASIDMKPFASSAKPDIVVVDGMQDGDGGVGSSSISQEELEAFESAFGVPDGSPSGGSLIKAQIRSLQHSKVRGRIGVHSVEVIAPVGGLPRAPASRSPEGKIAEGALPGGASGYGR